MKSEPVTVAASMVCPGAGLFRTIISEKMGTLPVWLTLCSTSRLAFSPKSTAPGTSADPKKPWWSASALDLLQALLIVSLVN